MKAARFVILFLGICIIFIFCGEESHYYAYGFLEENPFFLVDSKNREMYSDGFSQQLMDMAKEYNVGLFAETEITGDDGLIELHVYFNSFLTDELKHKKLYREGKWNSILSDPVRVIIHDFSAFNKGKTEMPDRIYIVGEIETARIIRARIVDEYNASDVGMGSFPVETDIIVFLWIVVGLVFLFLTLIDVVISRKRGLIRAVIGGGRYRHFLNGAAVDVLGAVCSFLVARLLVGHFYILYNNGIHYCFLVALLILCNFLRFVFGKCDVKKALRQVQIDKNTLVVLSIVKIVITVCSLFVIAILLNEIHKTANVRKTFTSLEKLDDYYFVSCIGDSEEDEEEYLQYTATLFEQKVDKYRPLYISERGYGSIGTGDSQVVEVSYHARDMLELTSGYREEDYEAAYIVLIPDGAEWDEDSLQDDDSLKSACGNESRVILRYSGNHEIVCTTGGEGRLNLTICENPIVLLRNHKETGESVARVMADFSVSAMKVMVHLESEQDISELQAYSNKTYNITMGKVIDLMKEQKRKQDTLVMSEGILCALILLYNVLLSCQLTQVDYLVNKRKNAIGFILGLTVAERYRKTIIRYSVTMALSLAVTIILSVKLRFSLIGLLILFGVALYAVDIMLYLFRMRYMEKKGIKSSIVGGVYA
ncbi:MAG: hypothetical protein IJL03_11125 [Lachnospiraceae bacterium]|nr:hypothetical protein [Lachnospiraceae bacterium]